MKYEFNIADITIEDAITYMKAHKMFKTSLEIIAMRLDDLEIPYEKIIRGNSMWIRIPKVCSLYTDNGSFYHNTIIEVAVWGDSDWDYDCRYNYITDTDAENAFSILMDAYNNQPKNLSDYYINGDFWIPKKEMNDSIMAEILELIKRTSYYEYGYALISEDNMWIVTQNLT